MDPAAQNFNLVLAQSASLLRHDERWAVAGHSPQQFAVIGRWLKQLLAGQSALTSENIVIQPQSSLLLLRPVTVPATSFENRRDFFVKVDGCRRWRFLRTTCQ